MRTAAEYLPIVPISPMTPILPTFGRPQLNELAALARKKTLRVAGLMSGTSADGVSAAIVDIAPRQIRTLAFRTFPYPPEVRKRINMIITGEINRRLSLNITDAFCGFKAYRTSALAKISLTETGYAMPLELWAQAYRLGLKIVEVAVPMIYLDENRSFGGALDQAEVRLAVYRRVLENSLKEAV